MEEPSEVEEPTILEDTAEVSTTTTSDIKPHTPHINFVDVNDENRFSVVIFVDLTAEKEEWLLQ